MVKFSIYLNRHVFVMHSVCNQGEIRKIFVRILLLSGAKLWSIVVVDEIIGATMCINILSNVVPVKDHSACKSKLSAQSYLGSMWIATYPRLL